MYFASLKCPDGGDPAIEQFITMEWHSQYVENTLGVGDAHQVTTSQAEIDGTPKLKRARLGEAKGKSLVCVRLYMNASYFYTAVRQAWLQEMPKGTFSAYRSPFEDQTPVKRFSVKELRVERLGICVDARRHCEIAMIELPLEKNMRDGITLCEKLWRNLGGLDRSYAPPNPLYDNPVRLIVFSGEINGRQQANKSNFHSTTSS